MSFCFHIHLKNNPTGILLANQLFTHICHHPNHGFFTLLTRSEEKEIYMRLIVNYVNRDAEEVARVFTQTGTDRSIKPLADAWSHPLWLTVEMDRRFTTKSATGDMVCKVKPIGRLREGIKEIKVEHEISHNDFPYLSDKQLSTVMPYESWSEFLKRLSPETQRSVFLSMLCDFTAADCQDYAKLTNPTEAMAYVYSDLVRSDNVEFFRHMVEQGKLHFSEVENYIKARAQAATALNTIYPIGANIL